MRRSKPHKALLRNYVQRTGITTWERWRYSFDFENSVYTVDGKKLRIRPAEELYLYERLVLRKRPKEATCRYAIQRLRERHGADFLAEAVCHSPSGGIEGSVRREGFERALRKYMEKDGRTAYEEQGYRFDFLNGRYTWNGDELRITPKEAVFLYERAVLRLRNSREQRRCTEANTLYHMRKKFGSVFLNEIFPVRRHRQWY